MDLAREIEIKLLITGNGLAEISAHPLFRPEAAVHRLVTTYYDAPDWRLSEARMAFRVRNADGRSEQTLKTSQDSASPMERIEWDAPLDKAQPEIGLLPDAPRERLRNILQGTALQPFATIEVERRIWRTGHGCSNIELALDRGVIAAGQEAEEIAELELELKQGQLDDLIDLVLTLPLGPNLGWSICSKGQRAYMKARGLRQEATKASPVLLEPDLPVTAIFQHVAWHCLDHLLRNYRLVIDRADEEALHQCRVAIRRLRAACSLFGDRLDDPESRLIRDEIAAAARALGPARNLDVIIKLARFGDREGAAQASADPLRRQLSRQRIAVYAEASAMLASASFQRLLFRIAAWINQGAWSRRCDDPETGSGIAYATAALRQRWKKIRKRARHFEDLDDAARHRLRIQIKKLRYATDFFAPLFTGRTQKARQRAFAAALGTLQDRLGDLNDLAMIRHVDLSEMDCVNAIERVRLSARLRQLLSSPERDERLLIEAARIALNRVRELAPFWDESPSATP